MGHYRRIDTGIHNDARFRKLDDSAKLLWFCLYTHQSLTGFGAMRCTAEGIMAEMKWTTKQKSAAGQKAFLALVQSGLIEYDDEACCLLFPKFWKRNLPENPNQAKAMAKLIDLVPECQLRTKGLWLIYSHLSGKTREAFGELLPEGLREQFKSGNISALNSSANSSRNSSRNSESESESESDKKISESGQPDPVKKKNGQRSESEQDRCAALEEIVEESIKVHYKNTLVKWAMKARKPSDYLYQTAGKLMKQTKEDQVVVRFMLEAFTMKDGMSMKGLLLQCRTRDHFFARYQEIMNKVKEFGKWGELKSMAYKWAEHQTAGMPNKLSSMLKGIGR